jgi:integrase
MKTYLPIYKDRKGKRKKCSHYYLTFVDNREIRRRLPAYTDKKATDNLGVMVDKLLDANGRLDRDLKKWFTGLMPRVRNKLVEFGLVDERTTTDHLNVPLTEHLTVFCESRLADGCKAAYVKRTKSDITRILNGCHFRLWTDIDAEAVKSFLAKGRGQNGYGERAYNSYLQSFRMFCKWLLESRGLSPNPMGRTKLMKQVNFRRERRPLSIAEQVKLLEATVKGRFHNCMTGAERSLAYNLAISTGARFSEIKSLKVLSFDFKATPPTVRVEASECKGKRTDDLILTDKLADAIKKHLVGKEPIEAAFNMPSVSMAAIMIKRDLAAAGIEYRDAAGRSVDFHSLRHTFCSNLALADVHPTVAQQLARHADIKITMKYYTHVLHESKVKAIDAVSVLTVACLNGRINETFVDSDRQTNIDNRVKSAIPA